MEALLVLVVLGVVGLLVLGPVLALVAMSKAGRLERELNDLGAGLSALETRLDALAKRLLAERGAAATPAPAAPLEPIAATTPTPAAPTPPPARPAAAPPSDVPRAPARPAPPPYRSPIAPSPPPDDAPDFATNLGPRILVATGALACIVFLALFVKYAWENNWVGPAGRVLSGAVASLGALAGGVRMLASRYRPLGQGLAGLGVAGLYVSAFGAHGFYDLIPRGAAGLLMVAVTAAAVVLADRLEARLLAALAWLGGYLTPLLLSTGEDRALALFLYLAVLDAGALLLDRRRPWPETVPLAFAGTMLLYAGWYARFFRPERFEAAAFGLVLFTALFALGTARRERGASFGLVLVASALGLAVLAAGADRPGFLMALSFALAAAALRHATSLGWGLSLVAGAGVALPFLAWAGAHYQPDGIGAAAAWVTGGMLLFLWPAHAGPPPVVFPALALVAGGLASIGLAAQTDRPVALLALLAAQAGIAVLLRARWVWAEVAGIATASLAVLAWFDSYYGPTRARDALLLAVSLAGLYLLALVVRSLVLRRDLGVAGLVAHLGNALFIWTILFRVLYDDNPGALGLVSVVLAVVYLVLGLSALESGRDALQARTLLALAAGFLTLAIPVQLGLHGITLAWAIEATLLLWLGVRFDSRLARGGGYAVLVLSVLRLLFRHAPLHAGAFTPVLNASFGTWLFVIASLGLAVWLAREARRRGVELDRLLGVALSTLALALLFTLLTMETREAFDQIARTARAEGRIDAAGAAARMAGLALSVLWTLFATGLLAGGLGLRSRPLFYAAYGLFAFTAAKVVLVDLATFPTLYRMLSFLALGVLLLAGAYLNLRFRERLLSGEARP